MSVTNLAQVESVIYLMLERTHLNFTNQFWLDVSVGEHSGENCTQMWQKQSHLVVDGRIEGCQRKAMVAEVLVFQHGGQEWHHHRPQNIVEGIA